MLTNFGAGAKFREVRAHLSDRTVLIKSKQTSLQVCELVVNYVTSRKTRDNGRTGELTRTCVRRLVITASKINALKLGEMKPARRESYAAPPLSPKLRPIPSPVFVYLTRPICACTYFIYTQLFVFFMTTC